MPKIHSTVLALHSGNTSIAGTGDDFLFTFAGTWATGDTYSFVLTNQSTAATTLVGSGNVTGKQPSFVFTFQNKVYALSGPGVYFSALALPTTFNDLNTSGNSFVIMNNWFATPEDLVAIAPYQGRLAFFTRRTTQIWQVNADPAQWQQVQVMQNIGTLAKNSVQPLGDLDVMFLSDTGVRSLRVRDSSLNAVVNDIGSPIDLDITDSLQAGTPTTNAAACAVVEPGSGRYWLHLNGVIYVLSYYPSSKIIAWGTYLPTYNVAGVQTAFTPQKFVIFQGLVYCLATLGNGSSIVLVYGGTNNATYDACPASFILPFADAKTPGTWKTSKGIDIIMEGTWDFTATQDYISGTYVEVATTGTPTNSTGTIPFPGTGTHFSMAGVCTDASAATVSSVLWHYEPANETS